MNPNEQEIESLLRHAPKPSPPPGLKQQLSDRVPLSDAGSTSRRSVTTPLSGGWLRRWWPALAPATAALAGAVVLAFQQMEIHDLQETIRTLSKDLPVVQPTSGAAPNEEEVRADAPADPSGNEQAEIERLKQLARQLAAEVLALEQVQKGNEALRVKLNAPPTLTQEELDALAKAKEKAMSIACVNNLKQFGLAVQIWANDNGNVNPPDILTMTNELSTPKILVCKAETNRPAASNWATYTPANCSYEYLAPSGSPTESQRVLSRCPIHGHIGLCDGSVQMGVAKNNPKWLIERDGKLYMERSTPSSKQ